MRVKVFSSHPCPFCDRAKSLLVRRDIAFEEVDLTRDPDALAALVARTGMRTVPQIFIDSKLIGGFMQLAQLDSAAELADLQSVPREA